MSQNARKWVLRNAHGLEIAVLNRTSNVGILCVVGGVVERFIATIVLTAVIAVDSCAKN
ncbi:hypothetical protein IW148_003932 [Coemansia sp. RSA 1199]|nr:hypothetical protein IW148_003932 [Coemansia sp. RSA 1199]